MALLAPLSASAEMLAGLPLETGGVVGQAVLRGAMANQALYLQTFINGVDTGLISPYRLVDGALFADAAELRALGFAVDEAWTGQSGMVELSRIPGLVYRVDTLRQTVEITVGAEQLQGRRYDVAAERLQPTASPGVLLNYDAFAQQQRVTTGAVTTYTETLSGLLDLRAFGSAGTLIQTGLFRDADPQPIGFEPALRLETTLFRSDANELSTWRAGDLISGASLGWVSPVRLGGLQWQRNFRLQPNLVTFPVPTITGSSAVPSTVDVFVNNVRQFSGAVEPGPFVIDNMPVITGQGEIRVVVRDALGREQVTTMPFFAAASLLKPGLVDFSVEAGYLRRNYAIESNDYDDRPAGLASARAGVTDWLTLEGHAEGAHGLLNGGLGGVVRLGLWGVVSGSLAGSERFGESGAQWSAAYQWFSRALSLSASTRRSDAAYRTLAGAVSGVPPVQRLTQASVSAPVGGGGVSLGYVEVVGSGLIAAGPGPETTRIGTASFSRGVGARWSVHGSVFREFGGEEGTGGTLGLSRFFGNRVAVSATGQYREPDGASGGIQAGQSLPAEGTGTGWRLQAASDRADSGGASVGYRFPAVTVEAGASGQGDATTGFAGLRGAIVGMDYRRWPMLTNPIRDSFALVDTGVPGVQVLHENRPVGASNASGLLLIPGLTAQSRNQISIDARDLPLDVEVAAVQAVAVPLDRSGVVVRFPVARSRSASVALRTAAGAPVPLGARVTVNGAETFPVGYDGQAYLKHLAARNELRVEWESGACVAELAYDEAAAPQGIEPVTCRERAQ